MYLLAASSASSSFGLIIAVAIFAIGAGKICSFLKANKAARDATKRGGLSILDKLFKK